MAAQIQIRFYMLAALGLTILSALGPFAFADTVAITSDTLGTMTPGLSRAESKVSFLPRWNMARLTGLHSFHDGANCFNAVLAAKGFNDYLSQSSDLELSFYLHNFCKPVVGRAIPGDVLAVNRESSYEHALIFMGHDLVFEKNSLGGLDGQFDDRSDSDYHMKSVRDSSYLSNCHAPDCEVQKFRCAPAAVVRPRMEACYELADHFGERQIQSDLESITLDPRHHVELKISTINKLAQLNENVRSINGTQPCDAYLLAMADGIVSHLLNQVDEQGRSLLAPRAYDLAHALNKSVMESQKKLLVQSSVQLAPAK